MGRRESSIFVIEISLLTVLAPFSLLKKPAILGVGDAELETEEDTAKAGARGAFLSSNIWRANAGD